MNASKMYVEDIEQEEGTEKGSGNAAQSVKGDSQRLRRARKRRHRSANRSQGRQRFSSTPTSFAWSQRVGTADDDKQQKPQNPHGHITVHEPTANTQKCEGRSQSNAKNSVTFNGIDAVESHSGPKVVNGLSNCSSRPTDVNYIDKNDVQTDSGPSEREVTKQSTQNGHVRHASTSAKVTPGNSKAGSANGSKKKAQARNRLSVNNFHSHVRGGPGRKTKAQTVTDYARSIIQRNAENANNGVPNGVSKQDSRNPKQRCQSPAPASQSRISSAPVLRLNPPHAASTRIASASLTSQRPPYDKTEETPYQRQLTAIHLDRINQSRDRLKSSTTPGVHFSDTASTCVDIEVTKVEGTIPTPTPTYVSGAPSPAANGMVFKRQYANPRILSLSYIGLMDQKKKSSNFSLLKQGDNSTSSDATTTSQEKQTLSLKIAQLKRDNGTVKPILKYPAEETRKKVRVSSSKSVRFHLPEAKPEPNPVKELRFLKLF